MVISFDPALSLLEFYTPAKEFQKNIYFCFTDYVKAFYCVDHNKLENSSRDGNTREICADQEATIRIRRGTTDQFQIEKGECQGLFCHPAYLTYMQSTS